MKRSHLFVNREVNSTYASKSYFYGSMGDVGLQVRFRGWSVANGSPW